MTSATTREDVEAACWKAGVRDPRRMNDLMRIIDIYAYALLQRPEVPDIPIPEPHPRTRRGSHHLYLCRVCDMRMGIEMFPPAKKDNPSHSYDCIACGGADRKTYACPECSQHKVIAEFPQAKQDNPKIRSLCSWCEKRTVTVKDVDRYRYRR
jgi:hypothetical protein